MGKQKTKKSVVKRFKVTKKGKVLHRSQYFRHLRSKKSKKRLRSLKRIKQIGNSYEKKIKKLLALK